jgi:transposase
VLSARPAGVCHHRFGRRETAITSLADPAPGCITIGVDTHHDVHVAAAVDPLGGLLGTRSIPTTPQGYQALLAWARGLGQPHAWGVEGTSSYGAGLARFLAQQGQRVVEVNRPDRAARRPRGKSDPVDAAAAARAVLSGRASVLPKAGTGIVEAIRALRVARAGAMKARTAAINQLKGLLVTAPPSVRERVQGLRRGRLVAACASLPAGAPATPQAGVTLALCWLARRIQGLDGEVCALGEQLDALVAQAAPALVGLFGVGTDSAGALLVAAGDNPDRLGSEAAFAALCGVAPVQASSGKTVRYRLNRGGNRQANAALYRIVVVRLRHDPTTRAYMARRLGQGKTRREVIRCLKRYVAREAYAALSKLNADVPAAA